jgi:hypothetical protein
MQSLALCGTIPFSRRIRDFTVSLAFLATLTPASFWGMGLGKTCNVLMTPCEVKKDL